MQHITMAVAEIKNKLEFWVLAVKTSKDGLSMPVLRSFLCATSTLLKLTELCGAGRTFLDLYLFSVK